MKLSSKIQSLTDMITPAVEACGVTLWGLEFRPQGKRSLLCIYIDVSDEQRLAAAQEPTAKDAKPPSVGVDDCKRVSHQVSGLLDVHDPIAGEFVLEVSSPGWDRQFFNATQLQGYIGDVIAVRLIQALNNRRKFNAKLVKATDELLEVHIELSPGNYEETVISIPVSNIDKANLVFQA